MRILVTNDDGITAPGILPLAQAMTQFGDVTVVAPDAEYSGAGAAIGAIWERRPHVTRHELDGVPTAWAVNGPPALAVLYARLGAFGDEFDLVVSGINPGANVGRSVYHSGTIGACLSGRNGGWSGIAVSQTSAIWGAEGQAWEDSVYLQKWHTAAAVCSTFVAGYLDETPRDVAVVNINVPNVEVDELEGWAYTEVGQVPPRAMEDVRLVSRPDEPNDFDVEVGWGEKVDLPAGSDGWAIERNLVSVTYLTRLQAEARSDLAAAEAALDGMLGRSVVTSE